MHTEIPQESKRNKHKRYTMLSEQLCRQMDADMLVRRQAALRLVQCNCASCQAEVITVVNRSKVKGDSAAWSLSEKKKSLSKACMF